MAQDTVKRDTETWAEYWIRLGMPEMVDKWLLPDKPVGPAIQTKDTILQEEPPMDLGQILVDLGTSYIQTKYAPRPVGQALQPVTTQPADWDWGIEGDIPFIDIVKKKRPGGRRRRRRLATVSDIRDLAALQSILGGGKAFTTWIATHPS